MSDVDDNPVLKVLFVIHFFGYLWTAELIKGVAVITIAGAISTDYWIEKKSGAVPWFPLFPSFSGDEPGVVSAATVGLG